MFLDPCKCHTAFDRNTHFPSPELMMLMMNLFCEVFYFILFSLSNSHV